MPENAQLEAWFAAAEAGDLTTAEDLLRRGVDVDATGPSGGTALWDAVHRGQIDMIRFLLDRGADPNEARYPQDCTPTTKAVERTNPRIASNPDRTALDFLVAAGGRLGLREAVLLGDVELARRLCDADPNLDVSSDTPFLLWNHTYLKLAVWFGTTEMVRFLLDRGADIEATDENGATILSDAASVGDLATVSLLLDRGADINKVDWFGRSPLSQAERAGYREISDLLHARGGLSGLICAAATGRLGVVRLLLSFGHDPARCGPDGRTARDWAASNGHLAVVAILDEHAGR